MPTSQKQKSILIIDDDHRVREVLSVALMRDGFATEGVESGGEGFKLYTENKFDALMIDEALFEINGLWLIRLLRLLDQHTTMIMISGVADLPTAVSGLRAGADDYISKPFKVWDLKDRLFTSINRRQIVAQKNKGEGVSEGESSHFKRLQEMEIPSKEYLTTLLPTIEKKILKWAGFSNSVREMAEAAAEKLSVRESDILLLGQTAELQTIGIGGIDPAMVEQAMSSSQEWRDTWRNAANQAGELLESIGAGATRCGELLRSVARNLNNRFKGSGKNKTLEQILWVATFCTAAEKWCTSQPSQSHDVIDSAIVNLENIAGIKVDPSISTAFIANPG